MSTKNRGASRHLLGPAPAVPLSDAERAVVERVKKRDGRKRDHALWRFGKNPPAFFYWWCW